MLPVRSTASIERKFQNISAVLDESGLDWIDGYKTLAHYQRELKAAVLAGAGPGHRLGEALAAYGSSALVAARVRRLATDDVVVGPPGRRTPVRTRTSVGLTGSALSGLRDFQARQLGLQAKSGLLNSSGRSLAASAGETSRIVWCGSPAPW